MTKAIRIARLIAIILLSIAGALASLWFALASVPGTPLSLVFAGVEILCLAHMFLAGAMLTREIQP